MFLKLYACYAALYFAFNDLILGCIPFRDRFFVKPVTLRDPALFKSNYGYISFGIFRESNHPIFLRNIESIKGTTRVFSNFSDYLERNKITEGGIEEDLYNILAIETSFDDTCAAVIRSDGKILSEEQVSQRGTVELFQGINPSYAYRIHQERIQDVIHRVLEKAGLSMNQIRKIAVTRGPGLEICLKVGYDMALELSKKFKIDLVDENHIAAHCLSPMIRDHQFKCYGNSRLSQSDELRYPYLCLLLSGGHSQIYVAQNPIKFHLLSDTQDRYAGNVLDKCARDLGLGIGDGGASSLESAAKNVKIPEYIFTIPSKACFFSEFCFSGIRTQLHLLIKSLLSEQDFQSISKLPKHTIDQLAYSCQDAVFNQILLQLEKAMDVCETLFGIRQVALVGGVGCNNKIKDMIVSMFERRKAMISTKCLSFLERMRRHISKFLKNGLKIRIEDDNDFLKIHTELIKKFNSLEDLMRYLLNPSLFSSLLTGKNRIKACIQDKNSIYRLLLYSYFHVLGDKVQILRKQLSKAIERRETISSSRTLLKELMNIDGNNSYLIKKHEVNHSDFSGNWELFTPSRKYCRDNAVMIGFSLLEKHKIGIKGINREEKIDGKDVLSKWDLGDRKCWEVLSDICKLHSFLST
ncbi:glycoprotein endopeptidase, putative [Theileria equi strain WA]|uniref:N(6)-L-threonylcarbamoyladenine synthase n=1 Tax=Theileria equi strain WA TaxID=1537102 RepID=L0B1E6_THEEQ|nr:glycoprotein endopeptidase, putative [Theileria equi strain WA]AFZ81692.1 glycoprotein endopeptidase, putative [Theileria equi strain WA]|eukprot:XP_004831358.1 glycoprotein endopeptidase, putative [Theileria equi strain WA]